MTLGQATNEKVGHAAVGVGLRWMPYPYRAMLTICSDLDATRGRHVYGEIMRFLNTTEPTAMGPGVGLEVGNSIFFRTQPWLFSYWDTDDAGRAMVRELIRSGHIDCLHSFGECVYTREEVKQALDELERSDHRLEVWVDHGSAVTNFGPDIMDGHGDEVWHPAYHADLTTKYGIKYVCLGRGTSVIGQDVAASLKGILNLGHPLASGRTVAKEAAKHLLARAGNRMYAMHGPNRTIRPVTLRDGRRVYEFMRCNPHWGGLSSCDQGRHIGKVLTRQMLARLVRRGGTCILYTHLGRVDNPAVPFNAEAVAALRRLAEEHHTGRILVTTTRRLLGYRRALHEIEWSSRWDGNRLHIDVNRRASKSWAGELPLTDLAGLTFYVRDSGPVCLTVDGRQVSDFERNAADHTGQPSVSFPWPRLEFPQIPSAG